MKGVAIINRVLKLNIIFIMVISFSSCSFIKTSNKTAESINKAQNSGQQEQEINIVKYPAVEETIGVLCSDEFQGRAIGSDGNEAAAKYIAKAFESLELLTLFEDSYYQIYYQGVNVPNTNGNERKLKELKNVVGVIKGKDSKKAVIISAHFDHIEYKDGSLIRGALDNASGVAALLEMASILKEKSKEHTFNMDIVFCAFNGEERRFGGSGAFTKAISSDIYSKLYNINIDCIGAKEGGKLALKNRSKVSDNLYDTVKSVFKKNNIEYAETAVFGGSDHLVFESIGIPNILITDENVREYIHKPIDTPEVIDCERIQKISQALCDFILSYDGITFE